jgi:hypothetical protein
VSNLKEKVKSVLLPIYLSQEVQDLYKEYVEDGGGTFGEFLVDYSEELVYHPNTLDELMEG